MDDHLNATIRKHLEEQERTVTSLADLEAFLRARLDGDEQVARAADQHSWTYEYGELQCRGGEDFEHLRRHDPARVLSDVAAKRRLLDDVLPIINELDEIAYGEGQGSVPYLEPRARFLKVLALPYADHEDYREEWRSKQ